MEHGFASGKEIASFFNVFLNDGLIGLFISCAIFGLIIYSVLVYTIKRQNIKYKDLIRNNKFLLNIIKSFTFICFCIMISAIGVYGEEQYNISFWWGAIFAGLICFISFLYKFNSLEKINNYLVPFILIGALMLGVFANKYISIDFTIKNIENANIFLNNWFLSAVLYAGYNSILLIPILVELQSYKLKRKDASLIAILSALLLCVAGNLIYGAINVHFPDIIRAELPTLVIAKACGNFVWLFYSIIILFAIFTTAFSCGYSFLKMSSEKNYVKNAALICILGVLFARIGFSNLINVCFPIFGYLGILQIIIIFLPKKNGR